MTYPPNQNLGVVLPLDSYKDLFIHSTMCCSSSYDTNDIDPDTVGVGLELIPIPLRNFTSIITACMKV